MLVESAPANRRSGSERDQARLCMLRWLRLAHRMVMAGYLIQAHAMHRDIAPILLLDGPEFYFLHGSPTFRLSRLESRSEWPFGPCETSRGLTDSWREAASGG